MITSATVVEIPGIVTMRSRAPRKGSITHLDPVGEVLDGLVVLVDLVQMESDQEGVVLVESTGQRLHQLRDLDPHPSFGQIGQFDRVANSLNQCLQHGPS
jgi:hypothetical protein